MVNMVNGRPPADASLAPPDIPIYMGSGGRAAPPRAKHGDERFRPWPARLLGVSLDNAAVRATRYRRVVSREHDPVAVDVNGRGRRGSGLGRGGTRWRAASLGGRINTSGTLDTAKSVALVLALQ